MKVKENIFGTVFYYSAIVAVILLSFFSFSYSRYPFFNSDAALSVLMSYDYHFPADLYCWGQDRGGTPEMMLAHFFIGIFHLSPIITSSVIHFTLITIGLFACFHFVRRPVNRFALSVLWFLPAHFFIESILYQFSIQFGMFMLALFLFSKAITSIKKKSLFLSLSLFFMLINIWVLDLGIIPVFFLLLSVVSAFIFGKKKQEAIIRSFSGKHIIISVLWLIAGLTFIVYAKNSAAHEPTHTETGVNSIHGISLTIKSFSNSVLSPVLFKGRLIESIYFYSVLFFLSALIISTRKNKTTSASGFFMSFFLGQAIFGILLLTCSKQIMLSDFPVRYFTGSYLSIAIYVLMKLETMEEKLFLKISLFAVVAISITSALYESYFPKKLAPMVEDFPLLKTMGPVGIIGSYWNSYVFSAIDPEKIIATPHDMDNVRNRMMAYNSLSQPTLLLIQNEWLENFPDTISQFGIPLLKKGQPFLIGTYISWNEVNPVMACEYLKNYPAP